MMLHHRIEWCCGGPAWSVDVPRAGPVGCTVGVVSVSRKPLRRGRHGGACPRTRGAAMGERARAHPVRARSASVRSMGYTSSTRPRSARFGAGLYAVGSEMDSIIPTTTRLNVAECRR